MLALSFLAVAPLAHADTVRIPTDGTPALTAEMPADWRSIPDDNGNLLIASPDTTTILMLSVRDMPKDVDLDVVAKIAFEAAKAEPYSSKQASVTVGRPGTTYASRVILNNITIQLSMALFRIDDGHIGCLARMERQDVSAEAKARLEAVAATVKVTGG
jgi:hypothetical protein